MSRSGYNEAHLMEALAASRGISRVGALDLIKAFTDVLTDELVTNGEVHLPEVGVLYVRSEPEGSKSKTPKNEVELQADDDLALLIDPKYVKEPPEPVEKLVEEPSQSA